VVLLEADPQALTDGDREQWLCSAWPTGTLRVGRLAAARSLLSREAR
jgi:hypothetical protein